MSDNKNERRIFKRSEVKDPKFYQAHRDEIVIALREGRIEDDIQTGKKDQSDLNMYQPPAAPISFNRSDIAAMDPKTYQANRKAILAALRGEGGARVEDDMSLPGKELGSPPVTIQENDGMPSWIK